LLKVPRGAKVTVDHDAGEIHFVELTGDIRAMMNQGAIIFSYRRRRSIRLTHRAGSAT